MNPKRKVLKGSFTENEDTDPVKEVEVAAERVQKPVRSPAECIADLMREELEGSNTGIA